MSLKSGNAITASDINALHNRVLAEITRRTNTSAKGSMKDLGYTTTNMAYSTTPAKNGNVLVEHANKIINPVNAINSSGMSSVSAGSTIKAFDGLDSKLTTFETRSQQTSKTGSDHLCNASCTGLCSTGCYSGCAGCGGACSTNCSGDCEGGCNTTCTGGCNGDCYNSCDRGCSYCSTSCGTGNCKGGCHNDCAKGCSETCAVLAGKT